MAADDDELQTAYTAAVDDVRGRLGHVHPLRIGGDDRDGERFTTVSPIDTAIAVGTFPSGVGGGRRRRRRRGAVGSGSLGGHAVASSGSKSSTAPPI